MADVRNVIQTIWESRDMGVSASIRTIRGELTQLGQQMELGGRGADVFNKQMRAMGTTIRYALAGASVYGVLNVIRAWGDFQTQLGQVSALTGDHGPALVGRQLQSLGSDIIAVSEKTAQPISDLESGLVSLYSTVDNVPPNKAADFMQTIAETANTSQSAVQETTDAVLGMMNAFGLGIGQAARAGNLFRTIIAESAAMPGSVFSQQSGRLFQAGAYGRFTPGQIGGLAIAATRFGGSQPANMQALAQMLQYLMNPPGGQKGQHEKALASIGLNAQRRAQLGGMGSLQVLLDYVQRLGAVTDPNRIKNASDDSTDLLSPQAAALLQQVFGRIQSQRVFATLVALNNRSVGGNESLQQYIADATAAYENNQRAAEQLDKANKRALDPATYKRAATAFHDFGLSIANTYSGILNPVFGGLANSTTFLSQHALATSLAGGGLAGSLGLLRLLRGRGAASGALRGLGRVGLGAQAVVSAIDNPNVLGGSPTNPMYVVVVGQLFGGNYRGPGGNVPPGVLTAEERAAAKDAETAAKFERLGRVGRILLPTAAVAGAGITAYNTFAGPTDAGATKGNVGSERKIGNRGALNVYYDAKSARFYQSQPGNKALPEIISYKQALSLLGPHQIQRRLDKLLSADQLRVAMEHGYLTKAQEQTLIKGKVEITVNVDQKDAQGRTQRTRYKVPVDLFPDFNSKPDTFRGGKPSPRGG